MEDLKTFKRMLHQINEILSHKEKCEMVRIFIIIIIGSLFELLGVSAILPLIEAIMNPEMLKEKAYISFASHVFGITSNNQLIILVAVAIVAIYILKNVYLSWSAYVQSVYNCEIQKNLSLKMYETYMKRPYEFFVSTDSGKILRGISADADSVYIVVQHIFKFLTQIITIISIVIYLFAIDWNMALMVIALGFLCFILVVLGIKRKINNAGEVARISNAEVNDWAIQSITGMKDIFVFNVKGYVTNRYDDLYKKQVKANSIYGFMSCLPTYVIEMICASGIILIVAIRAVSGGNLSSFVPNLSVFAMGAFKMLPAIAAASGYVSVFIYKRPALEGAYENIMAAREYEESVKKLDKDSNNKVDFKDSILIDNITWKYADRENKVLDKLSMNIKKGESVGIIGESGSGKSTFADVLLHLYRPQNGRIYMDGIDINTIPNAWNANLGYVSQTVFLLNDTIRNNVAFCQECIDEDKVWESLERASLKEFVMSLPERLDTVVGERGIKFSGGQRQRIAIARALYFNPSILVLDEATSALDNETEEAVMEAIDKLQGTLTMFIIAHRLTTIKNCDRVIAIKFGKAVELDVKEFQEK